jgi:UDP-3-O-[3-hydroxymyristoyl] glucosamine N-acyltransferase
MPDRRFFEHAGPFTLGELARTGGAEVDPSQADRLIYRAAPLVRSDERSISFFSDRRYLADLAVTGAGAVFVGPDFHESVPPGVAALVTREPQAAWAKTAQRLHPAIPLIGQELVNPTAVLEDGVLLGPGVVIGAGARIGRGTVVGASTVIGPGVSIGRDCQIGSSSYIGFALIGDRVRVAAGAIVGEAGFGVAGSSKGAVDVPQLGRAIQDGVTIGANTCIDRGAFNDTVIGENTKIDNMVQVAHNVVLGRNCILAAHTGLSGSVSVGDGVMFGGRAGVADHLTIGDGARIAAAAGIMKDVPAGETWAGFPAKPIRQWLRESAWLSKQAKSRDEDRGE